MLLGQICYYKEAPLILYRKWYDFHFDVQAYMTSQQIIFPASGACVVFPFQGSARFNWRLKK